MTAPTAQFCFATVEIILINALLSADNAVVIALACRHLDPRGRTVAMTYGVLGTVILLVCLTAFAGKLLALPWARPVAAALLVWIGIKLVVGENPAGGEQAACMAARLGSAVKTVIVADLAMSFDNVLGVAAVANGNLLLTTVGLGIGIPLVALGGALLVRLMERVRWLPLAGGGLLGWVAGDLATRDPAVLPWIGTRMSALHRFGPITGVAVVVIASAWLLQRQHGVGRGPFVEQRLPTSAAGSGPRRGSTNELGADGQPTA